MSYLNYDHYKTEAPPVYSLAEYREQFDPHYLMQPCSVCGEWRDEEDLQEGMCEECFEYLTHIES